MDVLLQLKRANLRSARNFRDRSDPLARSDEDLLKHYRFPREYILLILESIDLAPQTRRSHAIPGVITWCVTLNYYATGSLYSTLQNSFGISRTSISRIIHRVTARICNVYKDQIRFPDEDATNVNIHKFYQLARFPKVIGCIDGCQVSRLLYIIILFFISKNRYHYFVCHPFVFRDLNSHESSLDLYN